MVHEGRAAEVIACRQAKVKKPISGEYRRPVEENVVNGERGAREAIPVRMEDGEAGARGVLPAHVEDGDKGAREAVPAHVEDGDKGAREAVPAHVEDGDKGAREAVPAHVKDGKARATRVADQGRMAQVLPERADEKSSSVQSRDAQMARDDLTLSQLFATKTGLSGSE